jgi:hypothetical protein
MHGCHVQRFQFLHHLVHRCPTQVHPDTECWRFVVVLAQRQRIIVPVSLEPSSHHPCRMTERCGKCPNVILLTPSCHPGLAMSLCKHSCPMPTMPLVRKQEVIHGRPPLPSMSGQSKGQERADMCLKNTHARRSHLYVLVVASGGGTCGRGTEPMRRRRRRPRSTPFTNDAASGRTTLLQSSTCSVMAWSARPLWTISYTAIRRICMARCRRLNALQQLHQTPPQPSTILLAPSC